MTVLEIVTFKTVAGATDAVVVDAARACEPFLRRCEGFVARSVARAAYGTWLDCAEWTSEAAALAAAEAFPAATETAGYMALIDQADLSMRHFAVSYRRG